MRSIRIACFALLLTSSLTTPIAAQPDLVDGFSSASKRLSVKGGVISTTTAAIIWNEWYTSKNVNEYLIMWGKDQGVFTDTLDLLPYTNKVDIVSVIEELEPATSYFAQFWRVYEEETKVATPFTFSTPDPSGVRHAPANKQFSLSNQITAVALYSIDGKQIARKAYTSPKVLNGMLSAVTSPGTYLVRFFSGKTQLKTEQILVGQ